MHRRGVPKGIGYAQIEFSANIALFIPMGIIASVWTQRAWAGLLVGAGASLLIELAQSLFLTARYSSVLDVVANSLGAGIGAVAYYIAQRHYRSKPGYVAVVDLPETPSAETDR